MKDELLVFSYMSCTIDLYNNALTVHVNFALYVCDNIVWT